MAPWVFLSRIDWVGSAERSLRWDPDAFDPHSAQLTARKRRRSGPDAMRVRIYARASQICTAISAEQCEHRESGL